MTVISKRVCWYCGSDRFLHRLKDVRGKKSNDYVCHNHLEKGRPTAEDSSSLILGDNQEKVKAKREAYLARRKAETEENNRAYVKSVTQDAKIQGGEGR